MLSSWIGEMDVSAWPAAGLVIFFAVFVAVTARVALFTRPRHAAAMARIPLNDEPAAAGEQGQR